MIIVYPGNQGAGTRDDRLISFVDFAPTTIAMAGGEIPSHMHGRNFLNTNAKRQYIHAAADRFDEHRDSIRAVKDKRYKYIRNYRPEQGYYLPLKYREQIPTMQELLRLRDAGQLNTAQAQWFRSSKPVEELFDTATDPHELQNLIKEPALAKKVVELRNELNRWLGDIGDDPNLPESDLISRLWSEGNNQPQTIAPQLSIKEGSILAASKTPGATFSYQLERSGIRSPWRQLAGNVSGNQGDIFHVVAHRIGFLESNEVSITFK